MNYQKTLKFLVLLVFVTLLVSCGKQIRFPKIEEGVFSDRKIKTYSSRAVKITTGDTLKSVSEKYKVSIRELIKYNNLKTLYILKPGKTILIPKAIKYKIKKIDSLFKIAECSEVDLEDINQRNENLQAERTVFG